MARSEHLRSSLITLSKYTICSESLLEPFEKQSLSNSQGKKESHSFDKSIHTPGLQISCNQGWGNIAGYPFPFL